MRPSFPAHNQENRQRPQADDHLGLDGEAFLFARILVTLIRERTFNRLCSHVQPDRLESLPQQGFMPRQSQDRDQDVEMSAIQFVSIRFADPKHRAEFRKRRILAERDHGQQQFVRETQDGRFFAPTAQRMLLEMVIQISPNVLVDLTKGSVTDANSTAKSFAMTRFQGVKIRCVLFHQGASVFTMMSRLYDAQNNLSLEMLKSL